MLQGLAQAIVKLWEKSTIAKIAIKRGVPNTSNERMAEEIKVFISITHFMKSFLNFFYHCCCNFQ